MIRSDGTGRGLKTIEENGLEKGLNPSNKI